MQVGVPNMSSLLVDACSVLTFGKGITATTNLGEVQLEYQEESDSGDRELEDLNGLRNGGSDLDTSGRGNPPKDNHFEETSCIQSQRVVDWPRREEKYPKTKKESKYSSTDFKPNMKDTFSVIITNKKHLFHTEEEVYEYFISFGDVSKYLTRMGVIS